MLMEFTYTFTCEGLPFSETEDEIVEYMQFHEIRGFCWKQQNGYIRVITIGSTRRKVEIMKSFFKGYHLKELHEVEIMLDLIYPDDIKIYGYLDKRYLGENIEERGKRE